MTKIDRIDPNMAIARLPERADRVWRSAREEPFRIHGLYRPRDPGPFRRLPADVAEATSPGVAALALNTSGGRVRFVTDSPEVAIHARLGDICRMDHMAFTGIFGFDLYIRMDGRELYRGTFRPPVDIADGYESELTLPGGGPWEVTINFPLYNGLKELWIGLRDGCLLGPARDYRHPKPVVFYGSSITQGGCASRPGNSYAAMISRMLDCDYVNLGFSGSGKAEPPIVKYLSEMEMGAFVCDYDHNAPDVAYLAATHERLFRAVRERQPELPILLVSRPNVLWDVEQADQRREVILETYRHAVEAGDTNVAFLDGATLFDGWMPDSCTVDGCHPNDLGMYRMAEGIGRELSRWL